MGKTIEVCYSNTVAINKGNYENEKPFYSGKTVLEVPDRPEEIESAYKAHFEQIKAIVDPLVNADYNAKRTDLANIRIREKDGKKYPSVTSILTPDGLSSKIKNLEAYAERGNQADKIFKTYLTTGKLLKPNPKKFEPLEWDYDIKGFCETHGLVPDPKAWVADVEVFNDRWTYSGELDLVFEGRQVVDVKTGSYKWEQLAAYAYALDVPSAGVIDLKANKYHVKSMADMKNEMENFIYARGMFKARFGI